MTGGTYTLWDDEVDPGQPVAESEAEVSQRVLSHGPYNHGPHDQGPPETCPQPAPLHEPLETLAEGRADAQTRNQPEADAERRDTAGGLAAGTAHAINNPLAYVTTNIAYCMERLAHLETLLRGEGSVQIEDPRSIVGLLGPITEALAEANHGALRVGHLARNLSTLAARQELGVAPDLQAIVENAALICEGSYRGRARLQSEFGATSRVYAAPELLTQIVTNLIFCASASFTDSVPTRNRICLRLHAIGKEVVVDVEHNGPTFSGELIDEVEAPHHHASTAEDGPLLWLRSASRLANDIGGRLSLKNHGVHGVRMRVFLPGSERTASSNRGTGRPPALPRKGRILVVDNEPLIVRAIGRFLAHEYDIDSAEDGAEALAVLSGGPAPDLILCALMMPRMSGAALYEAVRAERPELAGRFAFLTGGALTPEISVFLRNSDRPSLVKPLDPQTLRSTVRELLFT